MRPCHEGASFRANPFLKAVTNLFVYLQLARRKLRRKMDFPTFTGVCILGDGFIHAKCLQSYSITLLGAVEPTFPFLQGSVRKCPLDGKPSNNEYIRCQLRRKCRRFPRLLDAFSTSLDLIMVSNMYMVVLETIWLHVLLKNQDSDAHKMSHHYRNFVFVTSTWSWKIRYKTESYTPLGLILTFLYRTLL